MSVAKLVPKKKPAAARTKGLIGLFGHTYVTDSENPDAAPIIKWQFQIIRELKGGRYVLQLFSWMDGDPTEVVVMPETEILGRTVKLYANRDDWCRAYEKQCDRERWKREAKA